MYDTHIVSKDHVESVGQQMPGTWSMTVLSTPATTDGGARKQDNQNVGGEYLWYSDILAGLHTRHKTQDVLPGAVTCCYWGVVTSSSTYTLHTL